MSETLKPCPFCGSEAHVIVSSDGYGVECWGELCVKNQLAEIPTEAEAIAAWNTRAADKPETFHDDFYDCESTVDAGEQDSRYKLETDILKWLRMDKGDVHDGFDIGRQSLRGRVFGYLDRQAYITRREVLCQPDERDEQIAELQVQVDALTAERDEWKNVADELREEVTSLYAKMVRIKKVMGE